MRPTGTISVTTMATPERMAPATKYGAKMVVCQPGTMETAKSHDTTECTESTSGVASAARKRYARVKCRHSRSVPRQPSESTAYVFLRHGTVAESLAAAMSGIRPMKKNTDDTVRYVVTAN